MAQKIDRTQEPISINPNALRAWAIQETDRSKNKSQVKLAKALNISRAAVNDWVNNGSSALFQETIESIAKYTGKSSEETIAFLREQTKIEYLPKAKTHDSSNYCAVTGLEVRVSKIESDSVATNRRLDDALTMLAVLAEELKTLKNENEQFRSAFAKGSFSVL